MIKQQLYFLGIGGIGMSALAQYFVQQEHEVYGYDRIRHLVNFSWMMSIVIDDHRGFLDSNAKSPVNTSKMLQGRRD